MASKDMTSEQFEQLLAATLNERDKLIFRLLAGTGIRSNECVTLKVRNLDLDARIIYLENSNTKNGKHRKVVVPSSLIEDLSAWIKDMESEDYLFVGQTIKNGKLQHLTTARLRTIFYRSCERAGIQKDIGTNKDGQTKHEFSLHSLRHYHAVQSLKAGVPINSLQKQLGHSSLKTTQIYLDKSTSERIKDYDGFEI